MLALVLVMWRSGPEVPKQGDGEHDSDGDRVQRPGHALLKRVEQDPTGVLLLAGRRVSSHWMLMSGVRTARVGYANQLSSAPGDVKK